MRLSEFLVTPLISTSCFSCVHLSSLNKHHGFQVWLPIYRYFTILEQQIDTHSFVSLCTILTIDSLQPARRENCKKSRQPSRMVLTSTWWQATRIVKHHSFSLHREVTKTLLQSSLPIMPWSTVRITTVWMRCGLYAGINLQTTVWWQQSALLFAACYLMAAIFKQRYPQQHCSESGVVCELLLFVDCCCL